MSRGSSNNNKKTYKQKHRKRSRLKLIFFLNSTTNFRCVTQKQQILQFSRGAESITESTDPLTFFYIFFSSLTFRFPVCPVFLFVAFLLIETKLTLKKLSLTTTTFEFEHTWNHFFPPTLHPITPTPPVVFLQQLNTKNICL